MRLIVGAAVFGLLCAPSAVADEATRQVAVSDIEPLRTFAGAGELNDAELRTVTGRGADADGGAGRPGTMDLSVILFDEVGKPKGGGSSAPAGRTGGNSVMTRGINVGVGR